MLDALKFRIRGDNNTGAAFGRLKQDLKSTDGMLASIRTKANRAGRSMRNIGLGMSAAITAPVSLLGKQALEFYAVQEEAETAVAQVVKSTNQAAGFTADELFRMAAGFQKITSYGDEDILRNVTVPMATFTKVTGPEFERAQMSVLDMATALKTDLKSAALQVGKALNDPAKGITALTRSGVSFTEKQKDMIKALVKTGDVAGAQGMILQELETQFGGQAAALAGTTRGMLDSMNNAVGDLKESLGKEIVPFLVPLVESVRDGVDWFGKLEPVVKRNIVVIGGLAAVAGPALAIMGLGVLAIGPLIGVLGALLSPVALAVGALAGLGYVAYSNWDAWKEAYPGITGLIEKTAIKITDSFKASEDDHMNFFAASKSLTMAWVKGIDGILQGDWKAAWESASGEWKNAYNEMFGDATRNLVAITGALMRFTGLDEFVGKFTGLKDRVAVHWLALRADLALRWIEIKEMVSQWPADFMKLGGDLIDGLILGVQNKAASLKESILGVGRSIKGWFTGEVEIQSPSKVFKKYGGNLIEGLALGITGSGALAQGALSQLTGVLKQTAMADLSGALKGGASDDVLQGIIDKYEAMGTKVNSAAQSAAGLFKGIVQGGEAASSAIDSMLSRLGDKARTQGIEGIFGLISSGSGGGVFGQVVDWLFNANGNAFSGGRVTAFANGGVVTRATGFGMAGNRLGVMGEAGPEAIMPLTRVGGKLGVRAAGGGSGGGQGPQQIELILHAPEGVTIETVRSEAAIVVRQAAPGIVQQSKVAVQAANRATKSFLNG